MLTPIDIREKEFEKGRGYTREVRTFLSKVAGEYEVLYSKNAEMTDRISQLEAKLANYEKIENTMKNALVLAQKTADSTIEAANKEAENILLNARIKAEKLYIENVDKNNRIKIANKSLLDRFENYKKLVIDQINQQLEILSNIEVNFEPDDVKINNETIEHDIPDLNDLSDYRNDSDLTDEYLDEDYLDDGYIDDDNLDDSSYYDYEDSYDDYPEYDDLDDLENLDDFEIYEDNKNKK